MQDREATGPGARFLDVIRNTVGVVALAALPSAAVAQYAQSAPQQPQNYPAQAPQQGAGQYAPPAPPPPQAWSYQNPPPVPGQVSPQEARVLMQQPGFKAGFAESTNNYHNTPAQVHLPIWNGDQYAFVQNASAYLRSYASEVAVLTEQATASHNNTVDGNGALAGGSYVFSAQAHQALDNFMINFPFANLVARAGRNPVACGVPQVGGDPVYFPANNSDPEALRIRNIRIADYANHVADCLDETVPPGHAVGGKVGGWLAKHGVQTNIQTAPAAQGAGWTLAIANSVSYLADRLMETKGTFANIVRANTTLSPQDAAALWQSPHAELKVPNSKLPDLGRVAFLANPQLSGGQ